MHVKSSLLSAVLMVAASSLSIDSTAQDNPNYHKSHTRPVIPFKHATLAAPPGMVYIPGGTVTIKYSQSSTDTNSKKRVSLSSFYMDKTEVTNQQYRMFTEWIIDSVAITQFIKDDRFFMDNPVDKKKGGSSKETVATTTPAATADTAMTSLAPTDVPGTPAVASTATTTATVAAAGQTPKDTIKQRRRINWAKVSHKAIFESNDEEIKAKIAPMFDEQGKIRKELYQFPFTYLKATGTNVGVKPGEYATETINIYPDEQVWFRDINNSQVEILVENYFTAPPFDDYPVVGVNWKQARAFAYWRSLTNADFAYIADYLKYYRLQYSLPSEAQWVYAAGKDMKALQERQKEDDEMFAEDSAAAAESVASTDSAVAPSDAVAKDTTGLITDNSGLVVNEKDNSSTKEKEKEEGNESKKKKKKEKGSSSEEQPIAKKRNGIVDRDRDGTLLVNFKQEEGEYTADGANFTLPVMSYAPNEFGVYNMVGNVAEWVLDAYSPSTFAFVSDVNPVLLYDADSTDADAMKRKVVRGGSFMSNAKALSPFSRDYYMQNDVHCYIGFRCVMAAPDILNRSVSTRRRTTVTEKKAK